MNYRMTNKQLDDFQTHLYHEERSQGTIEKYLRDIKSLCVFLRGKAVTKEAVIAWKDHLLCQNYAISTINSMLVAVNGFFRYMGWKECCVKALKRQRQIFRDQQRELSRTEYIRLLKAAQSRGNHRLFLVIQTICSTGIRVSELQFITVDAVDTGKALVHCKGKIRTILLPKDLRKLLNSWIKKQRISSGPIFVTRNGKPLDRSNIWHDMKNLCKDAQIDPQKVFPHNLRHLFARTFYRLDKDLSKLADVLGHASIETTRIYIMETGLTHERLVSRLELLL